MWNCFVRCQCCRNATAFLAFLSASDVDTVIKVNYDHSVCLDPITIIISISRQTIIGGGNGSSIRQEAASASTTPSSRPASQPILLFCQSIDSAAAPPPPPNERDRIRSCK